MEKSKGFEQDDLRLYKAHERTPRPRAKCIYFSCHFRDRDSYIPLPPFILPSFELHPILVAESPHLKHIRQAAS